MVIPVVMEEGMRNTCLWKGLLRAEIGNLLYVDMTSDDEVAFVGKCEELYRRIAGILHLENVSSSGKSEIITPTKLSSGGSSTMIDKKHDNQQHQKKEDESSAVHRPTALTREEESKPTEHVKVSGKPQDCFKDSVILAEQSLAGLISFLPGSVTSTSLLYRGSRDGFNKGVYHTKCDNQGPHLIIVKCDKGYIFGGYIAVNIPTSYGNFKWISEPKNSSFNISLTNHKVKIAKKYPIKPKKNKDAFHSNSTTYGFFFGYGDMYTADMKTVIFSISFTYDYCEDTLRFTGKKKSTIAEVEVWKTEI
jgi:hypothetical protein